MVLLCSGRKKERRDVVESRCVDKVQVFEDALAGCLLRYLWVDISSVRLAEGVYIPELSLYREGFAPGGVVH